MPKAATSLVSKQAAEKQIAGFIDKFNPEIAKLIREVRTFLRKRFPTGHELVYDNYNFFVIGYAATDRASDALLSLAAYAKGVNIFFLWGQKFDDPHHLLLGKGKQVRQLRIDHPALLRDKRVEALFIEAEYHAPTPLQTSGKGSTIIKSISVKQRPRR